MATQPLLTPYNLGALELKNRVVMAPMTRSRADNPENAPTELHVTYYTQRASAGLLISEGTQISKQGVGYINTPGIYSDAQVAGWKKVTEAVHAQGGKIFAQLWHVGRISHPDFHNGALPVAPSALNPNDKSFTPQGFKDTVTPRALETHEVKAIVEDFRRAAANAVQASFDGVELHAANGYLLHQFFNGTTNLRTDQYGGSIENRARILFEILDALNGTIDLNRVGVRFNPSLHGPFGITADEETIPTFEYMVKRLNSYNLAYLHLTEPFAPVEGIPFLISQIAKHFRPLYQGTLIINKSFTRETGNEVIANGDADLVAFGVPYIANPDLVERFEQEAELAQPDKDLFYTGGAKGYIDYPALAEATTH